MQRMLCAAAAALVLMGAAPADAAARPHVYYRVKCAGLYCWPVAEPMAPHKPSPAAKRAHRKDAPCVP
jgi:hypothetical protein